MVASTYYIEKDQKYNKKGRHSNTSSKSLDKKLVCFYLFCIIVNLTISKMVTTMRKSGLFYALERKYLSDFKYALSTC